MKLTKFAWYTWGVLAYNLVVILWGAYVRATGSGAGCGSHWPLCNGEVIPRSARLETLIEFTHRLSSGLAFLLVAFLFVWALRSLAKGNPARKAAIFSMLFITTEALVGAGLVLFEWVAQDASTGRAVAMAIHLINTFFLLAAVTLTGWWASGGRAIQYKSHGISTLGFSAAIAGIIVLGVSGALTALGDTLFPVSSVSEGIAQDFSPTAHFLIRLRLLHPIIAIILGVYVVILASAIRISQRSQVTKRLSEALVVIFVIQIGAGLLNIYLLAPVWMQLVHLLLADLNWILVILLMASTLTRQEALDRESAVDSTPIYPLANESSS